MSSVSEGREIKHSTRGRQLQGPRPSPLRVSNASTTIKKSSLVHNPNRSKVNPVVIYLRSPKIIHVRPEEFMSLVQRLTGKESKTNESFNPPSSPSSNSCDMVGDDEFRKTMNKRDNFFGADHDDQMKAFINEVDYGDQILGLSPTLLRFLACI